MSDNLAPPPPQSDPPDQDKSKTAPPADRSDQAESETTEVLRV
jgi:hypothetical protein